MTIQRFNPLETGMTSISTLTSTNFFKNVNDMFSRYYKNDDVFRRFKSSSHSGVLPVVKWSMNQNTNRIQEMFKANLHEYDKE